MLNNFHKNITENEGSQATYIETTAEILNFAYVKNTPAFKRSLQLYCKATIVIYTCILTRDTRVNSSVENSFIESLCSQVGLYMCKLHMLNYKCNFSIKLTPAVQMQVFDYTAMASLYSLGSPQISQ